MKIGLQLYSLRDFLGTKAGLLETLDKLAAMGYQGVEVAGVGCLESENPEVTPEEVGQYVKERGMVVTGAHMGWNSLGQDTAKDIAFLKALGANFVAIPVPPEGVHATGPAGYKKWLAEAKPVAETLKASGITMAYHNHAMEFERFWPAGDRPYDVLIEDAPWLQMELDTYWVHNSGTDVLATLARLNGRLQVVHVKDVAPFGWKTTFAPVGEGNLNWDAILPACKAAGTEWVIVEQDTCERDHFESVGSSVKYLKSVL